MLEKDPFRDAERHTRCPTCYNLLFWNKEDGLKGQRCSCGYEFHGRERPSYAGNQPWVHDELQFPRLLAEIRAVGLTDDQYKVLRESMDLTSGDIDELLERAEGTWNQIKACGL